MAFIVKKKILGREYYYLRESKRVDGKVKAVTKAYLGKTKKEAEEKKRELEEEEKKERDKVKKDNNIGKFMNSEINDKSKGYDNSYETMMRDSDRKESYDNSKDRKKGASKNYRNGIKGKNNDSDGLTDYDISQKNKKAKNSSKESKEFVSFVQEQGLIWGPEPELYGGMAGFYTYGPLGKLLKNKVEGSVRKVFNSNGLREVEGPTVMPNKVWEASGHLGTFADRVVRCKKCDSVFRADKLIEEKFEVSAEAFSDEKLLNFIKEKGINCVSCGSDFKDKIERVSLMMETKVAGEDAALRPETATVTYLPFLRIQNYFRKKVPFGVFQIGKAYRNEISPRQGVLRGREFTQAEGQLFVDPNKKNEWEKFNEISGEKLPFWTWQEQEEGEFVRNEISLGSALKKGLFSSKAYGWCLWLAFKQFEGFGIPKERIRLRQHAPDEKAFYADDAWDVEIKMNNYGWVEVCGVHDRTDYDLTQHGKASGVKLESVRENGEKFVPHVLEIAFGIDRPVYALIDIFYDKKEEGEGKTMLKVPYSIAPVDVAIFPLMKKPELVKLSMKVRESLEKNFVVDYDLSGSIGKRYLRAAKAGTPFAVTIDYDSLEDNSVTVRDRDSEKQIRVKIDELKEKVEKLLSGEEKI